MKPGQKVVCIDDSNQGNWTITVLLNSVKEKDIYTIRGMCDFNDKTGLYLEGLICGYHHDGEEAAFRGSRFRLVDYTFGENIEEFIEELILTE